MSDPDHAPSPAAARRERSPEAREAARAKRAERDRRIGGLLDRGVSVAEISRREGLSMSRTRGLVRREPQPPTRYLAAEARRLNAALRSAYDAMAGFASRPNFRAARQVRAIVRELDPIHGFAPDRNGRRRPPPPCDSARKFRRNRLESLETELEFGRPIATTGVPFSTVHWERHSPGKIAATD